MISKLKKILSEETSTEEYMDFINKMVCEEENDDDKYPYPIKKSQAVSIAMKDNTLKTDFCRNSDRHGISYLGFNYYDVKVVEKDNKTYWEFKVSDGDISWIEYSDDGTTFCDGFFTKDDLKYLRCLIDVETGDYIYYPNVKIYKKRIVKYVEPKTEVSPELLEWIKEVENRDYKEYE